ncbi:MAG: ferredoxin family protein [Nitrospirae bacterium]|nr:ferredoxin family protein [Nitrospirota bacterium]
MKGKIVIDKQMCKGCKYCVMSCPKGVIVIKEQFNERGYFTAHPEHMGKCTGCALCAQMCPELAIEVWAENNRKKKA